MTKLIHTNVDCYISSRGEWEDEPTIQDLKDVLRDFGHEEFAEELHDSREVHCGDGSSTQYELV